MTFHNVLLSLPFYDAKKHVIVKDPIFDITSKFENLVIASKADSTWSKYKSGWNLFNEFLLNQEISPNWPVSNTVIKTFIVWSFYEKNLSANTIKAYLSSIKIAHQLMNLAPTTWENDPMIKMMLMGVENSHCISKKVSPARRPMNLNLLMILSHRIADLEWCDFSKQVVWTACTVAFFTSLRMGELLEKKECGFNEFKSFQWKHVLSSENDGFVLRIPYSKVEKYNGKYAYLFPFSLKDYCPVNALKLLKKMAVESKIYDRNKQVFSFKSGKCLTTAKLNKLLQEFFSKECSNSLSKITCHSFRAALPNIIGQNINVMSVKELKEWGNWRSDSCFIYTKDESERKKFLFKKIEELILMNV